MRLSDVNTRDIPGAAALGCRTMGSVFNADDGNMPFFGSCVWPKEKAGLSFSKWTSESHVSGRHLNALLNAEDAFGIELPSGAVEEHARAAHFSYSGPAPLPLNRTAPGGPLKAFCAHNVREGLHALYSLAKYRSDEKTKETAERSIQFILESWTPKGGWDKQRLVNDFGLEWLDTLSFVHDLGRALGPLVKYYRVTQSERALHLAMLVRDKLVDEFFVADGRFDVDVFKYHSHSATCCMSSLAQMADLTNDAALFERVRAFYDNGLRAMRDEIGWSPESARQVTGGQTDHGEANNTGDILETALLLARHGWTDYYDDAELILRAHLLPSQLRDVSFIEEPDNPDGVDWLRNIADRHRGAWGFPAPYGHKSINAGRAGGLYFNMDIVGGVVGSLCEAWREAVYSDDLGHHVNLLFSKDTPAVEVRSPYPDGRLTVRMRQPGTLFLRLPWWADRHAMGLDCRTQDFFWDGNRLVFPNLPADKRLDVNLPLAERTITMERNHIHPIRVRLRGDEVAAMDAFGADFTYFPDFEEQA